MNIMLIQTVLVAVSLSTSTVVEGCSCAARPTICNRENFLIFGQVSTLIEQTQPNSYPMIITNKTYIVNVLKSYNGLVGDHLTLTSSGGSGSTCGVDLTVGERYIISSRKGETESAMDLCGTYKLQVNALWITEADRLIAVQENACSRNEELIERSGEDPDRSRSVNSNDRTVSTWDSLLGVGMKHEQRKARQEKKSSTWMEKLWNGEI